MAMEIKALEQRIRVLFSQSIPPLLRVDTRLMMGHRMRVTAQPEAELVWHGVTSRRRLTTWISDARLKSDVKR